MTFPTILSNLGRLLPLEHAPVKLPDTVSDRHNPFKLSSHNTGAVINNASLKLASRHSVYLSWADVVTDYSTSNCSKAPWGLPSCSWVASQVLYFTESLVGDSAQIITFSGRNPINSPLGTSLYYGRRFSRSIVPRQG